MALAQLKQLRKRSPFPQLPSLIAITEHQRHDFLQVVGRLPSESWVIFRDYEARERRKLGHAVAEACRLRGLTFLVARDEELAVELQADGLHCPEGLLQRLQGLRLKHPRWLFTAGCHSEKAVRAARNVHAALFSPVFPTRSHPGGPTVGVERFQEVVRGNPQVPIYALGALHVMEQRGRCSDLLEASHVWVVELMKINTVRYSIHRCISLYTRERGG